MSYRNDRDADLARIEALEHELGNANRKIAELERPPAKPRAPERGPSPARRPVAPELVIKGALDGQRTYSFPYEIQTACCLAALQAIDASDGSLRGEIKIERPGWMIWRNTTGSRLIEILVEGGRTSLTCIDSTRGHRPLAILGAAIIAVVGVLQTSEPVLQVLGTLAVVALLAFSVVAVAMIPTKDLWTELCDHTAKRLAQDPPPKDPPRG